RSSGRSQATVMAISFTSDDAQTAAAVVNEYVTRVLEENRAMRTALAEETMDFFQQEVDRLTQVLSEKSADIVEFKRQNAQALPTSLTYRQDRLSTLEERLSQVERELATLEEQELRLRELF